MPRLSNPAYLRQRNELRAEWFDHQAWSFSRLDPIEEMELHAFFAPTKNLTDEEAFDHRRLVSKRDPSLPQRAGRAFAQAKVFLGRAPESVSAPATPIKSVGRSKPVRGEVIVYSVQRPEPDVQRVIEVLRRIEKEQTERDQKDRAA